MIRAPALTADATFHLALGVRDIDRSIAFYTQLFGKQPDLARNGYARFELPAVVFTLNRVAEPAGGPHHLGIRLPDTRAFQDVHRWASGAGLPVREQTGVECCYARQDKLWLEDPDGNAWELYVVLDRDAQATDAGSGCEPDCCAPNLQ